MRLFNINLQPIIDREFRALSVGGIFFCLISIYLIASHVIHRNAEERHLFACQQHELKLKHTMDSANYLLQSNSICQLHGMIILDSAAVELIVSRQHPDSIQSLYTMLMYKGWKFENPEQFASSHLPADWADDLYRLMHQRAHFIQLLSKTAVTLDTFTLATEISRIKQYKIIGIALFIFVIGLYPSRIIYYYIQRTRLFNR